MDKSQAETLAEIRGFLRAFEWVNGKTNHGYCFEITLAPLNEDLSAAVAAQFARDQPTRLTISPATNWRELLNSTLSHWLLKYLQDPPVLGRLEDKSRTFSLSTASCQQEMVDPLVDQIESLSPIQSAHTISVETAGFYACESADLVLVAAEHLVFLHFDVCD